MVVFFLCPFSYFFGVFIKILNLIVLPTEKYNTHFLTFCPSPPPPSALLLLHLCSGHFFLLIQRPERVCRSSSSRSHNRSMAEKKSEKKQNGGRCKTNNFTAFHKYHPSKGPPNMPTRTVPHQTSVSMRGSSFKIPN